MDRSQLGDLARQHLDRALRFDQVELVGVHLLDQDRVQSGLFVTESPE